MMYYIKAGMYKDKDGKIQFISPTALRTAWNVPPMDCVMKPEALITGLKYIVLEADPSGEYKKMPKPREYLGRSKNIFGTLNWS